MMEQAVNPILSATSDCWKTTPYPYGYKPADNYLGAININESFSHLALLFPSWVQFRFSSTQVSAPGFSFWPNPNFKAT